MFTGIIEEIGKVREAAGDSMTIAARKVLEGTRLGDSIDVNGACLTVTSIGDGVFRVELMPETRRRTNLGKLGYGDTVNLERAMPVNGRVGGHQVQGHIDDTGRVISVTAEERAKVMKVSLPSELSKYIVKKGFVAVDGVSLTVVDRTEGWFSVSLVKLTQEATTLGAKWPGETVNLEVDIIGKYVESFLKRVGKG
jgi:riboflavin synthase